MTHSIYLSGPISEVSLNIAQEWRASFEEAVQQVGSPLIRCINPMRFRLTTPMSTEDPTYITSRDRFDVQRADLLVVNFLYQPHQETISIGSVIEMAWADAWRKPIIMAVPVNWKSRLFTHPFIQDIVTTIVYTEQELIYQARAFLSLTESRSEVDILEPSVDSTAAEPTPDCPF